MRDVGGGFHASLALSGIPSAMDSAERSGLSYVFEECAAVVSEVSYLAKNAGDRPHLKIQPLHKRF